ncbi:MAG: ribosomal protection-like ABC-F family protein [Candidatus Zixiibacteriota bacterium]
MTLLTLEKISKRYNEQVIFNRVSLTINSGDRIGLVGKNGSGKTTLFELITGSREMDSGTININKKCLINYSEQEKDEYLRLTLFDYVSSARQDLLDMRHEIIQLEEQLSNYPDNHNYLTQLGKLQIQYEHAGGYNFENEIKIVIAGLGFEKDRYNDRMKNFSGGEKNRAGLAKVLAGKGNLLLLDEPTNHLDIESTCWLEEYLTKSNKSYLVVSHDRTFLTNIVEKVWEINNGRIDIYSGNFEKYLNQRLERRRLHQHHYKHQQEEIKRIEDFIRRNMAGQKTKQAQSKLKYLQRIKRLPPPDSENHSHSIQVKSSGRSYAHILEVDEVSVGYGEKTVTTGISFDVYRGDKIGMIGANGTGKSTILKTLIGELSPIDGEIKLGNNVDVVYFDQELSELEQEKTALENIWTVDPMAESGVMRSYLGRFGFTGEESLKKVASLSGGEKTKLSLAMLLYHPANFIIFDEPTNHLDMISREALEDALIKYEGSFLIVSHDRYFLDRVVSKIFSIDGRHLTIFDGNYSYYKDKISENTVITGPKNIKSKQAHLAFKEKSKQRSRIKKEIQATRSKIDNLETELEQLIKEINQKIPKSDWEKLRDSTLHKSKLENNILQLYHKLEDLEAYKFD